MSLKVLNHKVKTAVIGATGFTGEKLVEILLKHPGVDLTYLASRTPKPVAYSKFFGRFRKKTNLFCEPLDIKKAAKKSEFLFVSLPHTASMEYIPYLIMQGKKVVDLSADYRIKKASNYKKYYHKAHKDKVNLKKAVYGLSEIFKDKIKKAKLIANPGCYPTSVILGLYPFLKDGLIKGEVIVDSKSSITGAGRKAVIEYHYSNIANNFWAYKPFVHQHVPEIEAILKEACGHAFGLLFSPHVAGIEAGIYSTIYVPLKKKISRETVKKIYDSYYRDCPFVRVSQDLPKLKEVIGTNFCDIGFAISPDSRYCMVVSCIDNLIKGAAGSAVQNMNIMQGWPETLGLL
ncbi:MAG: N-acetyl-gamma-glutamyl-phosphate reductase [Candidatus Omnitrophica bacterium]|nr:N-acetyl-gamma-glutamyl-phosphate reductase [Candidatus Omnitrophota bacterium]MDD5429572.1 N-acetyl-gamma-glutamyl-phosphate reductase [Candidatus Omnitrophota bacterium]